MPEEHNMKYNVREDTNKQHPSIQGCSDLPAAACSVGPISPSRLSNIAKCSEQSQIALQLSFLTKSKIKTITDAMNAVELQ